MQDRDDDLRDYPHPSGFKVIDGVHVENGPAEKERILTGFHSTHHVIYIPSFE